MAMKVFDVVVPKPGKEEGKVTWKNVGVMLEKEDGKRSIKIDFIPTDKDWDGWFTVVEQKPKEEKKDDKKKGGKK